VPSDRGLATGDVYAEADRTGAARSRLDSEPLRDLARQPADRIAAQLENDLEPAALSLRPELVQTIDALRAAGALGVRVAGSGPTTFGVFAERPAAEQAAAGFESAIVTGLRQLS
jgi:4-diphosphocytidyl-2-C-methyl-D-erythritol kinase